MHIPDGYISPQTCIVAFAAVTPVWIAAVQRVQRVVKTRSVPFLAVLSALSFLIMMFNVPIPDGTTAHAVGGTLIAILLGPWAAVIAVSVALLFQALLFGDGGVLAFGANALNIAVILPFVGYGVYRLIAGRAPLTSTRRMVAAGIGGYAGINAAGLATAVMLGIQPGLFHAADGTPLYSPYNLAQTIPAMALAHLTVAGLVEAVLCAGVVAYLQRADVGRLALNHAGIPATATESATTPARWSPTKVTVVFVAIMVALTPLGLLAPGGAFGEDAPEDLDLAAHGLQAIPTGLAKYNGFWSHALLGDYGFADGEHPTLAYLISAVIGIAVVGAAIFLIAYAVRRLARGKVPAAVAGVPDVAGGVDAMMPGARPEDAAGGRPT